MQFMNSMQVNMNTIVNLHRGDKSSLNIYMESQKTWGKQKTILSKITILEELQVQILNYIAQPKRYNFETSFYLSHIGKAQ